MKHIRYLTQANHKPVILEIYLHVTFFLLKTVYMYTKLYDKNVNDNRKKRHHFFGKYL